MLSAVSISISCYIMMCYQLFQSVSPITIDLLLLPFSCYQLNAIDIDMDDLLGFFDNYDPLDISVE